MKLDPTRTVILLVDVQERLCAAMPPDDLTRLVKYAKALIGTARELEIPVLATEQYPKGLGPTLPVLRELLPSAPIEKMHFSCVPDPKFAAALEATRRRQVVIAGMETHVCVYQTARDLVRSGHDVHVCADAVASRFELHRQVGLELCRQADAVVTTAESAIFDLLGQCGTPQFKKASALVK
jgi:nicotinamidase-related amidase